jgi:hypothetical protein
MAVDVSLLEEPMVILFIFVWDSTFPPSSLHNDPSLQNCLKSWVVECFFGENGNLGLTKNMVQMKLLLKYFSLT